MIGSDTVVIFKEFDTNPIGYDEATGTLVGGHSPMPFKFSDFQNGFVGGIGALVRRTEEGERWELVK